VGLWRGGGAATASRCWCCRGKDAAFAVCIRKRPRIPAHLRTAVCLNSITAAIGAIQVADALKWLPPASLEPRLTTLDVWNGGVRQIACGPRSGVSGLRTAPVSPYWMANAASRSASAAETLSRFTERSGPIDLLQLQLRLKPLGEVRANEFGLRFSAGLMR